MKKNIIFIFKLILWLIFPFLWFIATIDTDIPFFYNDYNAIIIFLIIYFFFRFFLAIIFRKKKNLFINLILLNIIIFLITVYLISLYDNFLKQPLVNKLIDNDLDMISNNIIWTLKNNKNTYINNIEDFLVKYPQNNEYTVYFHCYYLSRIENWSWFILAYKYNSKEYIEKYKTNYFLYKSIPDYKITTEEMAKIQETINKDCLK